MSFITKDNLGLRFQQLIILVLHLILIKWMYYTLFEMGMEKTEIVLMHYTGMSIYGALLIRGCAAWGKYRHQVDLKEEQEIQSEN
ncbi:MAG: hypothetical protein NXH75_01250 [Halobacteriovoraceae bacterium]|nr:hypothetical protein [Halobacteriovoraceae bacterium]